MTAEKSDMFIIKTSEPPIPLVLLPQIYLSLMRSGEVDCGSLKCSFVDSSSERYVKKDEKTAFNTGQCSHKMSFLTKNIHVFIIFF